MVRNKGGRMIKKLKNIILILGLVLGIGVFVAVPVSADIYDCETYPDSILCQNQDEDLMTYVKNIVNTMLYVLGALSVIMIIYGGIRYTTSAGDAKHVESAKNTIMYAVVGLVVALLAYAIVNFVIEQLLK
jgi:glucose uptake protein GlcU